MNSVAHHGTRLSASLSAVIAWNLLIGGCNDPFTAPITRDGSTEGEDTATATSDDGHDAEANAGRRDGGADACVPKQADDAFSCANQHCTGPLLKYANEHAFVPGGGCRFISAKGFTEGSCAGGKMHFREQFTVGGPWIEYWDEQNKYVAEDFGSDVKEFCDGTALRIVRGDVAAAAACEASRTDEHTVCSDADAGF